jgi:hypothetical protein
MGMYTRFSLLGTDFHQIVHITNDDTSGSWESKKDGSNELMHIVAGHGWITGCISFNQGMHACNYSWFLRKITAKRKELYPSAHDILLETKHFLEICRLPCILSILAAAMD